MHTHRARECTLHSWQARSQPRLTYPHSPHIAEKHVCPHEWKCALQSQHAREINNWPDGRIESEGRRDAHVAPTLKRPRTPSAAAIARRARKLPRNGNTPGCRPRCVAADTYTHVKGVTMMDCTANIRFALALFRLMRPRSTAASLRSGRTCSAGQGRGTAMRQTKLDTVSRSGWSIVAAAATSSW